MSDSSSKRGLKLVVIGLDGATWDVIQPMVAGGDLPNIAGLIEKGVSGKLKSTIPPFSAPAWATFMTGANPGKHGIFGFVNFNPQSYSQIESKFVTSSSLTGHTIFDILSQAGYRSAVISVPITYPAWSINGYMVSGEPCPDTNKGLAQPDSFAESLTRRYAFQSTFWSKSNDEIIDGLKNMDDSRTELVIRLIREEQLDALFLVLGATDRVQHNFWRFHDPAFGSRLGLKHVAKYESVISDTYRRADEAIGRILDQVTDRTLVFVISDHGGGPAATKNLNTNAWLQSEGYLEIIRQQDNLANQLRGIAVLAKSFIDTPMGSKVRNLLPARIINQGRALVRNIAQIDWARSRAYRFQMYPPAEGIVINLAGRQAKGTIQPNGEYDRLREEIVERISQVKDPETGEPVVVKTYMREELYRGPFLERAPDIVLILKDDYSGGIALHPPLISLVKPDTLTKVNGEHRLHGILVASGPGLKRDHLIRGAKLVDIAPTLLFSLGLPVQTMMDGNILKDIFTPEFLTTNPETSSNFLEEAEIRSSTLSLSPEEEEQIKEHLSRLGYL